MSVAAHTPGEWELVTSDDPRGQPVSYYRGLIALVQRAPEGTIAIVTKDGRPVAPEEWLANGSVLAAAPDLLAALEEIARNGGATILGPLADTEGFHALGAATAFEWCAQIARGAIAKATGETP